MEKIESSNLLDDTISNRLFDCYRIALDYGLDIQDIAVENLLQKEKHSSDLKSVQEKTDI